MVWNPFQYQLTATYLSIEGDAAVLELKKGALVNQIRFPRNLLPTNLEVGNTFNLKLEDNETAKTSEAEALRRLLSELIN